MPKFDPRRWLVALSCLACVAAQAAVVLVRGNQTSDVIASGTDADGQRVGERITEHPGTTGLVPATPAGVHLGQTLGVDVAGAEASVVLGGHARLGDLGIFGSAEAGINELGGVAASAKGGIHAEWRADMTLFSNHLADGSEVSLLVTLMVDGAGGLLDDTGSSNFLRALFSMPGLGEAAGIRCSDFVGTCDFHETRTLTGRVGTTYALSGLLELGVLTATSRADAIFANSASVSAGNSARFFLQVLTPGVDYRLDDGSQFPILPGAVPEPAAIWLVLLGLAMVAQPRRTSVRLATMVARAKAAARPQRAGRA